jgi:hypothetical protein
MEEKDRNGTVKALKQETLKAQNQRRKWSRRLEL